MFEKLAYAAPAPAVAGDGSNPIHFFIMMSLVMVVFYLFMIRPQQKKQAELNKQIANLKKGDKIVTAGGIIGTITSIQNDYLVIKAGDNDNTKMEVLKSAVTGLRESQS